MGLVAPNVDVSHTSAADAVPSVKAEATVEVAVVSDRSCPVASDVTAVSVVWSNVS